MATSFSLKVEFFKITHGETVLKNKEIWWFYHLVVSKVRNRNHKREFQVTSNGEKKIL